MTIEDEVRLFHSLFDGLPISMDKFLPLGYQNSGVGTYGGGVNVWSKNYI